MFRNLQHQRCRKTLNTSRNVGYTSVEMNTVFSHSDRCFKYRYPRRIVAVPGSRLAEQCFLHLGGVLESQLWALRAGRCRRSSRPRGAEADPRPETAPGAAASARPPGQRGTTARSQARRRRRSAGALCWYALEARAEARVEADPACPGASVGAQPLARRRNDYRKFSFATPSTSARCMQCARNTLYCVQKENTPVSAHSVQLSLLGRS